MLCLSSTRRRVGVWSLPSFRLFRDLFVLSTVVVWRLLFIETRNRLRIIQIPLRKAREEGRYNGGQIRWVDIYTNCTRPRKKRCGCAYVRFLDLSPPGQVRQKPVEWSCWREGERPGTEVEHLISWAGGEREQDLMKFRYQRDARRTWASLSSWRCHYESRKTWFPGRCFARPVLYLLFGIDSGVVMLDVFL